MTDRMQIFEGHELDLIHDAAMEILGRTGVRFHSSEALAVFQQHGFRSDGRSVFFTETDVKTALEKVPSRFTVRAINRENDVAIGGDDFVLLPTGGAPNVSACNGGQRPATLEDYHTCCKLVQTSDQLDMNGCLMVQPTDLPPETAHLDMLFANMVMCDKAYVGAAMFRAAAIDSLEMAAIAWGGKDGLQKAPVMAAIVSATSPLQYPADEADAIIAMARAGQAVVITDLVMAGTSGPISLPGLLALANAEILAGIVLAQLAGPGTPMVYGSVSAPTDMRTVTSAVGAPEAVVLASAVIQLARYYGLPCRTGGMLTNSHCPDAQAAAEGTLMMSTALRNGANFIFHACGQLGSYISMSFEKWLIDEEVCRTLRRVLAGMQITVESIDIETITNVGIDGSYLLHPTTFKHCRELYQPVIFTRSDYAGWLNRGAESADEQAAGALAERLSQYTRPAIDEGLEQALKEFVDRRKKNVYPTSTGSTGRIP
jgi:trimethylamine--corrinoid protein Co-methyltransferase